MKVLKKRVNIIAIMMFIIYTMMLMIDLKNSSKEKEQTAQEITLSEQEQSEILAEYENR